MGRLSEVLEPVFRARGAAVMGVLNVTPDSFYDGGRFLDAGTAAQRIDELVQEGADIVDVGGESSRPRAEPVTANEQIARIEPAVRHAIRRGDVLVSVDTTSPEVAERMLELGAHMVNDVSCLADPELARRAARHGATLIIMHSRGAMRDMTGFSQYPDDGYTDVVHDVLGEWRSARDRAIAEGLPREDVWLDPGLGFAKNAAHSFALLQRLDELAREGVPVVVGPSRKSFLAAVDRAPPERRLGGTIAACLLAVERGACVLRVHDVEPVRQALQVARRATSQKAEAS